MNNKLKRFIAKSLSGLMIFSTALSVFPAQAFAANTQIRQEINILDSYDYAPSGSYATSSEMVNLDPSQYNGATYYFEAVASTTGLTTATISLVNATSSAVAATITLTGGRTSYGVDRSASFTAPVMATDYVVRLGNEAIGKGVTAARIIILQNAATITSTMTQIEIGNSQTYTGLATSSLAAPKYWYYDAASWDGSPTFQAEVTYQVLNGVASTTIYNTAGTRTVVLPPGTASTSIGLWGGGASGGGSPATSGRNGSGGTGGQFASSTLLATTTTHSLTVAASTNGTSGAAGTWGATTTWDGTLVRAGSGPPGLLGTGSNIASSTGVSTGCIGQICFAGGSGGGGTSVWGAGGGGGAGTSGAGNPATGAAVAGVAKAVGGGAGGAKITSAAAGTSAAASVGGGGGGSMTSSSLARAGGAGGLGMAYITSIYATTTISVQEDNGQFAGWATKVTIVGNAAPLTGVPVRVRSGNFTPNDGHHYRLAFANKDPSDTIAIYNAKIIVDQTNPTKLEAQYQIENTIDNSTGLGGDDTTFNPAEWANVSNVYLHQIDSSVDAADSAKLQQDPHGTPADITGSTVTGANMATSTLTMPGSTQTIDTNILNTPIYGSRILVQVHPPPSAPTVTTQAESAVTQTTGTANGNITATGGANVTVRGFAYGTDSTLATVIATTTENGSFSTGAFTGSLSSLTCNTTYYDRPYATNPGGTGLGTIDSFVTLPCNPTVTTQAESVVTQTTATMNGTITVTGGGNATVRGFAYGTDSTLATVIATTTENGSFGTGAFTFGASSLTCNTTYYSRPYATNPGGTGLGTVDSFVTLPCNPTVTTQAESAITQTTVTLNGTITVTGGTGAVVTVRGFAYGTDSTLATVIATTTDSVGQPFNTGAFTGAISSLTCNTTYYSRPYATNPGGTGLGTIDSFITSPCIPTVVTQAESAVTQTSATLNGNITATGGATVTNRGFAWGTLATLSGGDTATTTDAGSWGTGTFTANLATLTCNTTYYDRAYATNSSGTDVDVIDTFTTSACTSPPTVTTQSASSVTQTSATLNGNITATGGANATTRGFAWGTLATLSGGDTATTTDPGSWSTGAFTNTPALTLVCNTTYYSRAYATNPAGTSFGAISSSFTTTACKPTVTTQSASSVGQTTATLNGNITATGGSNATTRGFAWGTVATLSGGDTATTTDPGSWGTGAFTNTPALTLVCNITYYSRAYATNPAGTSFGAVSASFTTTACAPTVTTQSASSVGQTTATLNGNITATGGSNATTRGFAWGTLSNLSGGDTATTTDPGSWSTGAFTNSSLTLVCNTTYYSRAYATNPGGTSMGAISASFTTTACAPTVTTQSASSVGQTTATLNGNITATGGSNATTRGFAWGTVTTLSGGDTATTTDPGSWSTGAFTNSALTFVCNTTYYSRAYATNPGGTSFGAVSASFTTTACTVPPTVTTSSATSVTATTAVLNGNITATGGANATQRGFAYGTDPTLAAVLATTTDPGSWSTGVFNTNPSPLTGLTCNTTYYSRAYATNSAGTSYGAISASFTTTTCAPTVTTQSASSVTQTSATLNGNITATGGSNATQRGFAWGTLTTLSGGDTATTTDPGSWSTGAFTNTPALTLVCNTTYYSRAYATNPAGTSFGAVSASFTTTPCAPTVTTQSASSVGQTTATLNGNITVQGGSNSTVRGFAWGTVTTLSGGDTATTTENGSFGTGAFTNSALTFVCNTTYYSRAYATNPAGTSFGAVSASFTTTACKPTVTTQSASSVLATTATLNGNITSTGGSNVTTRGFAYGTDVNLVTVIATTTENGSFTSGAYTGAISSLTCNTTYYSRAYATNPAGTSLGAISASFTTTTCAPTVTTQSASSVLATTATLNGNITSTGGAGANVTVRGFAYGTDPTLATVIATTTDSVGQPFNTGAFTGAISSLTCNTTYYSRAYATNPAGTSFGAISASFTTTACAPTVTTQSASSVAATTATLNGNITVQGGSNSTVRGFAWGTVTTLSGGDTATTTENGSFGTGAFTNSALTFVCNTTYYSRAYATNPAGTSFGTVSASFTTTACKPTVTTQSASSVAATTATLNGNITATGGSNVTTRGFAYGTDATLATVIATTTENGSFTSGAYTAAISSLTCNTTYYSRAYATNSGGTSFGAISASFTTSACAPTVTTQSASSVAATTATLNGNITSTGGTNATQRGFAWGTVATLSGGDTATTTDPGSWGTGAFTNSSLTLVCNTTYYSRAYATNPAGTSLGAVSASFTTTACKPTVTTQSASSVTQTSATLNGNITVTGGANATTRGFAWGTVATLSGGDTATTTDPGSWSTGAFTNTPALTLVCNTTYYSRAYATNPAGTSMGAISASFTTTACAPTVTTQSASSITATSATLNGNITATGGSNATQRGFAWGTVATLSGGDTATTTDPGSWSTGVFTNTPALTLVCNTTYYSRAYATNPAGTSLGAVSASFTTSACPTVQMSAYRFFDTSLAYTPGVALASQDTSATLGSSGDSFRMRLLLHIGGSGIATNQKAFKLQYSLKSGTCDSGFSGESYVDVTGATGISYKGTAGLTDNNPLGAASDIIHGADTIVNQTYEDANNFTNSQSSIPVGQDGKWDFSMYDNGATQGASYCLRVVNSDGSPIDTYPAVLPEIAIPTGTPAISQLHYRWLNDNGLENAATAAAPEDAPLTSAFVGDRRRLRILVSNSGTGTAQNVLYRLEYSSGSCTAWSAVPNSVAADPWSMDPSGYVVNGINTGTSPLLTHPGGQTFTPGYLLTSANQTVAENLPKTQYSELEYSIKSTATVTPGTDYCFRVTNGGSTTNFTYTTLSHATVSPAANRPSLGGNGAADSGSGTPTTGGTGTGGGGTPPGEGSGGGTPTGGGGAGGGGGDVGYAGNASKLAAASAADFPGQRLIDMVVGILKTFF